MIHVVLFVHVLLAIVAFVWPMASLPLGHEERRGD
jgi:hypothetical protein